MISTELAKLFFLLYISLQSYGYILVFKPTLILPSGKPKGNVDAELVMYTMIEYPNYEKAIIITGEGDFYCLIEYLERTEKLLRLIIPNRHKYSALLRKFASKITFMNGLKEKLRYKKGQ